MSTPLTGDARHKALESLPDWREVEGRDAIFRSFRAWSENIFRHARSERYFAASHDHLCQ